FSWFKRMGFVEENVFSRVPLVRRPLLIKPPFSPAEVQALLDGEDMDTPYGARNLALIKPLAGAHTLCVLLDRIGCRAGVLNVHPHRFRQPSPPGRSSPAPVRSMSRCCSAIRT
ncbi:MAG: hypothetical protein ABI939_08000, partial [Anaerolineaceae bacterium]